MPTNLTTTATTSINGLSSRVSFLQLMVKILSKPRNEDETKERKSLMRACLQDRLEKRVGTKAADRLAQLKNILQESRKTQSPASPQLWSLFGDVSREIYQITATQGSGIPDARLPRNIYRTVHSHFKGELSPRRIGWLLQISTEFARAEQSLEAVTNGITVFGSARSRPPEDPVYQSVVKIGELLAQDHAVITGGGPGLMEAANKGARLQGGMSVGLKIELSGLSTEQRPNPYLDKLVNFGKFFPRKYALLKYAKGLIAAPGGWGTNDEVYEVLTLFQTKKARIIPFVFFNPVMPETGRPFWNDFMEMQKNLVRTKMISPDDMDFFSLADTPEGVVETLERKLSVTK